MGTSGNVLVGAASDVTIASWVADKAASSFVSMGFTKGGVRVQQQMENYDTEVDQVNYIVKTTEIKRTVSIVVPVAEATVLNLRKFTGQPAANSSGSGSDLTLLVGDKSTTATEIYFTLKITGPGPGSTGVRTLSAWKCQVVQLGEWAFTKNGEQIFETTWRVLYDTTVTTADKLYRCVDA